MRGTTTCYPHARVIKPRISHSLKGIQAYLPCARVGVRNFSRGWFLEAKLRNYRLTNMLQYRSNGIPIVIRQTQSTSHLKSNVASCAYLRAAIYCILYLGVEYCMGYFKHIIDVTTALKTSAVHSDCRLWALPQENKTQFWRNLMGVIAWTCCKKLAPFLFFCCFDLRFIPVHILVSQSCNMQHIIYYIIFYSRARLHFTS